MLLNRQRSDMLMDRYGLDALVATTPENVTYLSDFPAPTHFRETDTVAVLPKDRSLEPTLVVSMGRMADVVMCKLTWFKDVRCYGDFYIEEESKKGLHTAEKELVKHTGKTRAPSLVETLKNTLEETAGRIKTRDR